MYKYLPPFLLKNRDLKELIRAEQLEFNTIDELIEDIYKQCFIKTSTWGLKYWEKDLGIKSDLSKSYEERREIIKAKKRGQGTATKKLIKNTAEAFSGGEVDVIEHNAESYFTIKFIGVKGIPKSMTAFKDMLENIKPAHLAYDFKYTYTVWNQLKESGLTWDNAKLKTWDDLKVFE